MTLKSLIRDDNAVNIVIGHILNLILIMIVTGGITGAFYIYADSSSQQSMRTGFTDLGSQIARDITNMYIISANSKNVNLTIKRDIPLTIGGRGYDVKIKNARNGGGSGSVASVEITDESFFGNRVSTNINSIDIGINASGIVYSGSGEINIRMIKNNTGVWLHIK